MKTVIVLDNSTIYRACDEFLQTLEKDVKILSEMKDLDVPLLIGTYKEQIAHLSEVMDFLNTFQDEEILLKANV